MIIIITSVKLKESESPMEESLAVVCSLMSVVNIIRATYVWTYIQVVDTLRGRKLIIIVRIHAFSEPFVPKGFIATRAAQHK